MAHQARKSRVGDVHELARRMPHVTVAYGPGNNVMYQVGGKSFIFFRNPRPDAVDRTTGEPYRDVIVFWVPSEADKQALVEAADSSFFTTAHFDGHPSVLLRGSRLGELTRQELAELVQGRLAITRLRSQSGDLARGARDHVAQRLGSPDQ
jgi:hypothetical protein